MSVRRGFTVHPIQNYLCRDFCLGGGKLREQGGIGGILLITGKPNNTVDFVCKFQNNCFSCLGGKLGSLEGGGGSFPCAPPPPPSLR